MKITNIDTLIEEFRNGRDVWSRTTVELAVREIERLQKENKELKEFVDATRPTGICEICTSNVISRYERLQARVQELEQERRWIPVSENPKETGEYIVIIQYDSCAKPKLDFCYFYKSIGWERQVGEVTYWMHKPKPPESES